ANPTGEVNLRLKSGKYWIRRIDIQKKPQNLQAQLLLDFATQLGPILKLLYRLPMLGSASNQRQMHQILIYAVG
ncbi:MAG: hypothetical protein WD251_05850, partial [Saccharospirillum sp.]